MENYNPNYPLEKALADVISAAEFNDNLPVEVRNNSITVVKKDGRPEMLVVNGPAQVMEPLFIELFRRRPELRQVVQGVLTQMFHIADY